MEIGFTEDFTTGVQLDASLTGVPTSGIYLNSGAHPSITLGNLLHFLPDYSFDIVLYDALTEYGKYYLSRNKRDIVSDIDGNLFESVAENNEGQPLDDLEYWLPTNRESLRLKVFIRSVQDRVFADLHLTKRLVNNQYIYEVGTNTVTLPNDYAAWIFEPKGSDYVRFRINEIAIQANTTNPVDLYVINQGQLIDTLTLTPNNGVFEFKRLDYTFSGKGRFIFAIDSQSVKIHGGYIDSLKYDGFICYTSTGIGMTPASAEYSLGGTAGNGLGFNLSVFLDSSLYIQNNVDQFAGIYRAAFEYMAFVMFLHNSNNRSNRSQRIQMIDQFLQAEVKDLSSDTAVKRYHDERKRMITRIERTFDTQINDNDEIEYSSESV